MSGEANVILTGFMATGKSAVGRTLAARLGRPFVDMDAEIEDRLGRTVADIFAHEGEARFREAEALLCRELSAQSGWVIATGGGTLVDPENRRRMQDAGTVVCLSCDLEETLRRLPATPSRPLLADGDPRTRIETLWSSRRKAYASFPWQIDTTGKTVDAVAEEIEAIAQRRILSVRTDDGPSCLLLGTGLLRHLGAALRDKGLGGASRVALISNPTVYGLHGQTARSSLDAAGFRTSIDLIPDGEAHKTLDTVRSLYDIFLERSLDRSSLVVGLGGGVITDIVGFAAATYMRGIDLVFVPTTLLSMIDAGIGGKTGVDLPQGKNLVGAFKQPRLIVVDPGVLSTLPAQEVRGGVAEMIKHGVLGDPALYEDLRTGSLDGTLWWEEEGERRIDRAIRVKASIVERDPHESGPRMRLNLGHTVGHALEVVSGYTLSHGEAVAIGMIAAARIAEQQGMTTSEWVGDVEAVASRWGLPVRCPAYPVEDICAAMGHDKKRADGRLRWILPRGIGDVVVTDDVPREVVRTVLVEMGARR